MARKIAKKAISEDLLFGADFDESKLAGIEKSLSQSSTADTPAEKQERSVTAGEARELPVPTESLDQAPLVKASPPETTPQDVAEQQRQAVARMVRSKMVLLLSVASLVVLITAGLVYLLWLQPPPVPQMVRHPIVVPSHTHVTNFLLFASASGKKKDLFKVDLELDFSSIEAYMNFKDKQVLYCDIIYKFLRKQEPLDNSFSHWEKILEKDLFESLRSNYPETRLNGVRLKGFTRL
jgi:hypothetical protein